MDTTPRPLTRLSDAEIAQMIAARPGEESLRESGQIVAYSLALAAQRRGAPDEEVASILGQVAAVALPMIADAEAPEDFSI